MDKLEYSVLFLGLYVIGLAYVSWKSKMHDAGEDFIIGSRSLGFWDIFGSIISYMRTGSNLVFWFSFVALMGFGSIWILISFYTGFILMTLLGPVAQRLSHQNNYITFSDLIEDRQGPLMSLCISLFSFYGILIITVSQLFVMGNVLSGLLNIGNIAGTFLGSAIVAAYIFAGGLLSVVRTDRFQAFVMIFIASLALLFGKWPEASVFQSQLVTPNMYLVLGFGLIGFAVPASTDMWQRFFAAKKPDIIIPSTFFALIIDTVIVLGIILFIQNILAIVPNVDPAAVYSGMFHQSSAHPAIIALFGTFVISAVMSTLSSQIFNFTSILTKNIFKINAEKERKKFLWALQIISVLSLFAFALCSLTIQNLMQWIIDTYAFVGVISPFIFYGVLHKAYSDKILAIGVFASCLCYWGLYAAGFFSSMYWYIVPYSTPLAFIAWDYFKSLNFGNNLKAVADTGN